CRAGRTAVVLGVRLHGERGGAAGGPDQEVRHAHRRLRGVYRLLRRRVGGLGIGVPTRRQQPDGGVPAGRGPRTAGGARHPPRPRARPQPRRGRDPAAPGQPGAGAGGTGVSEEVGTPRLVLLVALALPVVHTVGHVAVVLIAWGEAGSLRPAHAADLVLAAFIPVAIRGLVIVAAGITARLTAREKRR